MYGVFVSQGEVDAARKRFYGKLAKNANMYDNYDFIYNNGLEYIRVGKSREYVIGKRIEIYRKFVAVKLKFDDDTGEKMHLQHMNGTVPSIKLSYKEELEIRQKLFSVYFMALPDYYMVHAYTSHRIE